jgi:uncharacterized protein YciI
MSLSAYLLKDVERAARRPTHEEWLDDLANSAHIDVAGPSPVEVIRELQ